MWDEPEKTQRLLAQIQEFESLSLTLLDSFLWYFIHFPGKNEQIFFFLIFVYEHAYV